MKHLKTFENLQFPNIGDYIYVKVDSNFNLETEEKKDAANRIFKILDIKTQFGDLVYTIKAIPEKGKKNYNSWRLFGGNIICFSPTIKELKIKYQIQKFNI